MYSRLEVVKVGGIRVLRVVCSQFCCVAHGVVWAGGVSGLEGGREDPRVIFPRGSRNCDRAS